MPSNSLAAAVALGNRRSVPSSRNPNTSCGGGCCTGFYLRMANNMVADCGREACDTMRVRLDGMIVHHTFYAEDQSGADDRRRSARPGRPTRVPAAVPESQPGD